MTNKDRELIAQLRAAGMHGEADELEAALAAAEDSGDVRSMLGPVSVPMVGAREPVSPDLVRARKSFVPTALRDFEPLLPTFTKLMIWAGEVPFGPEGKLKWWAVAFDGRATKPFANYTFRNQQQFDEWLEKLIAQRRGIEERKEVAKVAHKAWRHSYKVGDILVASWGYDQTNVDFYQVVATTEGTIDVRPIASKYTDDRMNRVVAIPGHFTGPVQRRRPNEHGVRFASFKHARLWDGKPQYVTDPWSGH